jgi:glycosyltransferase involved in cell wall biosynthesis
MHLLINSPAVARSSRGVRRYAAGVLAHLQWSEGVNHLDATRAGALGRLQEMLESGRRDAILWTPCQRGSFRAHHHVVTVHDCISIEYTYRHDARLPIYLRMMGLLLRRAETVVAISQATRAAVLRHFSLRPEQVVVIASGMDAITGVPTDSPAPSATPFVLLVTNTLPHKNTLATCRAWARSRGPREGVELRIIGSLPNDARRVCQEAGVPMHMASGVDDASLVAAYRQCRFLIAPSLSEGHDLPVAEALSLGADVLCSDIDVHREYYEGQVAFFDPLREDAIVDALDRALDAPRPWFSRSSESPPRRFENVARDYESLFRSIETRHG